MATEPLDRGSGSWELRTANDVFKAGWRRRLHRSTLAAVVVHALLFLWSPSWDRGELRLERPDDQGGLEVVSLSSMPGLPGPPIEAPPVVGTIPDPVSEEVEEGGGASEAPGVGEDGSGPDEATFPTFAQALRGRLGGASAPAPEIVESEPQVEREVATVLGESEGSQEDGDQRSIPDAGLPDLEALSEEELMDLERLSALRPELALHSPNNWILVRNPGEVGTYLARTFRGRVLEETGPGSLSVAVWIDERGSVEWAEVNRSSGHPDLDASAVELFTDVVSFRPAREDGVRVPMAAVFWLSYPW